MLLTLLLSRHLWSLDFMSWYRLPSIYSIAICSFFDIGSRKMSSAGTRCAWFGRVRKKMTSRSSRQGAKESKVFFIVLMATWWELVSRRTINRCLLTSVPLLAMLAPAVLTRARATLPKLPSPISLSSSNRSSRQVIAPYDEPRGGKSYETVIMNPYACST